MLVILNKHIAEILGAANLSESSQRATSPGWPATALPHENFLFNGKGLQGV